MKEEINFDDDGTTSSEEYWRQLNPDEEDKPYFPLEESVPPHY